MNILFKCITGNILMLEFQNLFIIKASKFIYSREYVAITVFVLRPFALMTIVMGYKRIRTIVIGKKPGISPSIHSKEL